MRGKNRYVDEVLSSHMVAERGWFQLTAKLPKSRKFSIKNSASTSSRILTNHALLPCWPQEEKNGFSSEQMTGSCRRALWLYSYRVWSQSNHFLDYRRILMILGDFDNFEAQVVFFFFFFFVNVSLNTTLMWNSFLEDVRTNPSLISWRSQRKFVKKIP